MKLEGLGVDDLFVIGTRLPVSEPGSLPGVKPDNEHYAGGRGRPPPFASHHRFHLAGRSGDKSKAPGRGDGFRSILP